MRKGPKARWQRDKNFSEFSLFLLAARPEAFSGMQPPVCPLRILPAGARYGPGEISVLPSAGSSARPETGFDPATGTIRNSSANPESGPRWLQETAGAT